MIAIKKLPSFQDLRVQFDYNEDTGRLHTRDGNLRRSREAAFEIHRGNNSYRIVRVKYPSGRAASAFEHRVIWKLITGKEPPEQIDHKDGNGLNNRWTNLRDGSGGVNAKNLRKRKTNSTGYNAVRLKRGKWVAVDSRGVGIGSFTDVKDAAEAARDWRLRNGYTERHGIDEA